MISPTMKGFIPDFDLALMFAVEGHAGVMDMQGKPYILHPIRLMLMAREMGLDEVTQKALLMHDLVEDTEVTLEQIRFYFGDAVADIVDAMSRRKINGVKEEYFVFIDRIIASGPNTIKGKLLDIADNTRPERAVEGLSGLNGRYERAAYRLRRALRNENAEAEYEFLSKYNQTYTWV